MGGAATYVLKNEDEEVVSTIIHVLSLNPSTTVTQLYSTK